MPGTSESKLPEDDTGLNKRSARLALTVMALATLGSSWCGYQASLWNGIQTFHLADAFTLARQADLKSTTANQIRALDAALFLEYTRELQQNTKGSQFLLARMRPELREAIKAWSATQPLKNPNAPTTPFVMPQYRVKPEGEAQQLSARSTDSRQAAQTANMNSDTYSLLTVLYTAALFLSGLVSGFEDRRVRQIVLAFSMIMIVIATLFLLRLPMAHRG
jgi:hypothetical protein